MLSGILRGAGEPSYTLVAMIIGAGISIATVPLFIFGGGPVPPLGIAGGFLGLGSGRMAGMIVMAGVIATGRSRVKLGWRHFRPRPRVHIPADKPGLARFSSESAGAWRQCHPLAVALHVRDISPLAAWTIGNRVTLIARMPSFGLQSSVRTLVGQNVGADMPERAIRSVRLFPDRAGCSHGSGYNCARGICGRDCRPCLG